MQRLKVKEKGADRRVLRAGWVRQSVVPDLVLQTGRNQQGHSKIPFFLFNCPEHHDRKGECKATARNISVPRTALQLDWILWRDVVGMPAVLLMATPTCHAKLQGNGDKQGKVKPGGSEEEAQACCLSCEV